MAHATPSELAELLGRTFTATEVTKATVVLDIVSGAIDAYLGERTATAELKKYVALLAGVRLFTIPPGVVQEALGGFSAMYRAGELLSDDEKALLDFAGSTGVRKRRTASPRTTSGVWEEPDEVTLG